MRFINSDENISSVGIQINLICNSTFILRDYLFKKLLFYTLVYANEKSMQYDFLTISNNVNNHIIFSHRQIFG